MDLGILASEAARDTHGHAGTSWSIRPAPRATGCAGVPSVADLLSFLGFDRSCAAPLLELGGRAPALRSKH